MRLYNINNRSALCSHAAQWLWLATAIAGCKDSSSPPVSAGANANASGVSGIGAAGALAAGSAVAAGVSGAAGAAQPSAALPSSAGSAARAGSSGVTPPTAAGAPALVGGAGGGGTTNVTASGGAGAAAVSGGAGGVSSPAFPVVNDLAGTGPYSAKTVMSTGPGGTYTIYRPTELAPGGAKHPIVGWMSGGGSTPSMYTLLPHLASHGFVVVASNTAPALGDDAKLGKEIIAGIDWLLAENMKSDSEYHDKLKPLKLASMGYSMGALATTMIGGDPRLTTTVHISGGNMVTERIKMLHAPAAFICGASGVDIAGAGCATDFDAATVPVFYGVFNGGDHLGVRTQPYADRIRLVVTGWLRWQLMDDASLAQMFVGEQCTVCKDSNWTVKQKNLL